jgi:5-methylcytosine-specific restriction protein A
MHKIKEMAECASRCFVPASGATSGPIDLMATGDLGTGYQRGAIESFRYDLSALPSRESVEADFLALLHHYDTLVRVAGSSLQNLSPVSESQYQQAVLERSKKDVKDGNLYKEPPGPVAPPPRVTTNSASGYKRNPAVASAAVFAARFECEINNEHVTFVSSAKGRMYVEAHHLIPMSHQQEFVGVSLDVLANVVAGSCQQSCRVTSCSQL